MCYLQIMTFQMIYSCNPLNSFNCLFLSSYQSFSSLYHYPDCINLVTRVWHWRIVKCHDHYDDGHEMTGSLQSTVDIIQKKNSFSYCVGANPFQCSFTLRREWKFLDIKVLVQYLQNSIFEANLTCYESPLSEFVPHLLPPPLD